MAGAAAARLADWLQLPEARLLGDPDDPATTLCRARIIQRKPFLKRLYLDFYQRFRNAVEGGC
ncbi:MAG: hypothetical protein JSU63_20185, partial [Phycisphaerales bacterium]